VLPRSNSFPDNSELISNFHQFALDSFNFPAMIPLWAMAMATVTGNSLILKPSERDPGAAMILAELAERAG
jgi:malonate-semialdehyde dehydrogenase (acetylating)/methylmalonate-semialdehyde dehydrogenase